MNQQALQNSIAAVVPAVLASGVARSLCSIQQPSGVLTADGSPDGNWTAVDGLQNIVCMNAPTSNLRLTATEIKTSETVESDNGNHVWLAGYYPIIAANTQWRAVIDGVPYGLLGAECDSQGQTTRLSILAVSV